jgi:hypothetical protein
MKYLMLLIAVSCSSTITTKYIEREPDAGTDITTDHQINETSDSGNEEELDLDSGNEEELNCNCTSYQYCENNICLGCEPFSSQISTACSESYPNIPKYAYWCISNIPPDGCALYSTIPSSSTGKWLTCCPKSP